jgi:hypothetical protein
MEYTNEGKDFTFGKTEIYRSIDSSRGTHGHCFVTMHDANKLLLPPDNYNKMCEEKLENDKKNEKNENTQIGNKIN